MKINGVFAACLIKPQLFLGTDRTTPGYASDFSQSFDQRSKEIKDTGLHLTSF